MQRGVHGSTLAAPSHVARASRCAASLPLTVRRLLFPYLFVWVLGFAVIRIAVVPAEVCPDVTADEVHAAAVASADWLARNLDEDGKFVYGYNRETVEVNPDYNIVRHAGGTMSLYQMVLAGETDFLPAADRAMGYLLDRLVVADDYATIADHGDRARLGTVGFVVSSLIMRREATGDTSYDELMQQFGRFMLGQQLPDGAMLAFWDRETEAPSPNERGPFATGEALWALFELDRLYPEGGWDEPALLTAQYLARGQRERDEGYLARLPDHWAAYSLEAMAPDLRDEEMVEYARRLAGYFSMRTRIEAQRRGEGINVLVRYYPGPPAGVGTAGEGMAALYRMAAEDERLADLRPDMAERLECLAGIQVKSQISASQAAAGPNPGLTEGAWFYLDYTQVDGQQHVLSALLGAEQAMREMEETAE